MKKGNILIRTGLLLIAAALFLAGFNIWDNYRAGKAADSVLSQLAPMIEQMRERAENENGDPDYILNPDMDMPVVKIDGKDCIGVLSMPSIKRELPVISEWSYPNLKISACRYAGSAYLDNMIICAHNYDIHFGSLKYLRYGDEIIFTDVDGNVFSYEVVEIETLRPVAIEEMTAGDWDLTLFTCTIGGSTRITVRCEKLGF